MQISRFTASKPSKFAFASDEKSIRQPTTSFVRCYLRSADSENLATSNKSQVGVGETEGVKGAIADFVRFHCPLVASAEAKSPACGKVMLCLEDQRCGRANGRDNVQVMDRAAWGALLRERKVTGRDASLPAPFAGGFLWNGRPTSSWGVAPNPTRGAASGLRKGHCPLTLFCVPA